jgi:hypothetical protein
MTISSASLVLALAERRILFEFYPALSMGLRSDAWAADRAIYVAESRRKQFLRFAENSLDSCGGPAFLSEVHAFPRLNQRRFKNGAPDVSGMELLD